MISRILAYVLCLLAGTSLQAQLKVTGRVTLRDTTGEEGPAAGQLVMLNRANEECTTTTTGKYEIYTSTSAYAGQSITFTVPRKGWVLKDPSEGRSILPRFGNIVKTNLLMVRKGDLSLLNDAQIRAYVEAQIRQRTQGGGANKAIRTNFYERSYREYLGFDRDQWRQAVDDWMAHADTRTDQALVAQYHGDYSQALTLLREELKTMEGMQGANELPVRKLLVYAHLGMGNTKDAEAELDKIVNRSPYEFDAIKLKRDLKYENGNYRDADTYWEQYLPQIKDRFGSQSPEYKESLRLDALTKFKLGQPYLARDRYLESLKFGDAPNREAHVLRLEQFKLDILKDQELTEKMIGPRFRDMRLR